PCLLQHATPTRQQSSPPPTKPSTRYSTHSSSPSMSQAATTASALDSANRRRLDESIAQHVETAAYLAQQYAHDPDLATNCVIDTNNSRV
ncbi:hypothetical protein A4X13_0g7089, partial [Tilletia indica]